jgi:hypothetical protein
MSQTMTYSGVLVIRTCWCGIKHAIPKGLDDHIRRSKKNSAYCPLGHSYVVADNTDEERLAAAEAKVTHLNDQLQASKADAEKVRVALLRDRARWANGMCPCCRRNFPALTQHVKTEHPDYDIKAIKKPVYKCSCWQEFETFHGLRVHQGKVRLDNWATQNRYYAHLTVTD